jgi:hypothetical protein
VQDDLLSSSNTSTGSSARKKTITLLNSSFDCRKLGEINNIRAAGSYNAVCNANIAVVVLFPLCLEQFRIICLRGERNKRACHGSG